MRPLLSEPRCLDGRFKPASHVDEASPGKNTMLPCTTAAFTSVCEPNDFAVLCQLITTRRPFMRFLFISSQISHSLPSHPTSRLRSWPLVIVLSFYLLVLTIVDLHHFYIVPMLGTHKACHSIQVSSAVPLECTRRYAGEMI